MGNCRSPNDFVKEMYSADGELDLARPKLHDSRVIVKNSHRKRLGKTTDTDLIGETVTEIKGSEEKISKKTSTQMQSVLGKSEKKSFSMFIPFAILIRNILFAILVFTGWYLYVYCNSSLPKKAVNSDKFDSWFQKMENDFPDQYDFTWHILNRSLKKFLNDATNSREPTIILMLGTGDNRDTVNCLSDRVKTIVQDVFKEGDCPGIKSEELVKLNDTILKLEMEKNVTHTLTEMNCHALVIKNIDLLREVGLNLLQAYCDHENAPHKFVSIILTATTNKKPPTSLPKEKNKAILEFEKMAREHLDNAWKTVSSDYREAWLSRFMQYVVVMGELSRPPVCANKH